MTITQSHCNVARNKRAAMLLSQGDQKGAQCDSARRTDRDWERGKNCTWEAREGDCHAEDPLHTPWDVYLLTFGEQTPKRVCHTRPPLTPQPPLVFPAPSTVFRGCPPGWERQTGVSPSLTLEKHDMRVCWLFLSGFLGEVAAYECDCFAQTRTGISEQS